MYEYLMKHSLGDYLKPFLFGLILTVKGFLSNDNKKEDLHYYTHLYTLFT